MLFSLLLEVKSLIISGSWPYNSLTISILISVSLFYYGNLIHNFKLVWVWWPLDMMTIYCIWYMCELWLLYCRCGAGAVVGLWGNMMLVVGPDKDWINFNFDNPVHLVEEEDGLRIIGKYQHEFLYKVPGNESQWFITKMINLCSFYRLHTYMYDHWCSNANLSLLGVVLFF